jgi:hypothetical protein
MNKSEITRNKTLPSYFAVITLIITQIWLIMTIVDFATDSSINFEVFGAILLFGLILSAITIFLPIFYEDKIGIDEQFRVGLIGVANLLIIILTLIIMSSRHLG